MARVVFLQKIYYEFLGPTTIASVLKKGGHEVKLIISKSPHKIIPQIKDNDIVAFSLMTGGETWAFQVAQQIKKHRRVHVIFGGAHPTFFPEVIENEGVDSICRGEGEYPMLELAEAIDAKRDYTNIKNLWVKNNAKIYKNDLRPLIANLDELPYPDRELYYFDQLLRNNSLKPFTAGRGCPFSCSFCFNENLKALYRGKGKYIRWRSPDHIIGEVHRIKQRYPLKTILFTDDTFSLDKRWLLDFADKYAMQGQVPFVCSVRADTLDEEAVRALKKAGCYSVAFGIEAGNERIRNQVLCKRLTNEQIIHAASLLKQYGIKYMTYNLIGIPEETVGNVLETIELNMQIKTDYPRCSFLTPYPGTKIAQKAKLRTNIQVREESQQGELTIDHPEWAKMTNLHAFFQTAILFPRTYPLIKKIINWPPNPLFKAWWSLVYFWVWVRGEKRNLVQTIRFALRLISNKG